MVGRHRGGGVEDVGHGNRSITKLSSSGLDVADNDEVVGDDDVVANNADNDTGRRGDVVVDDDPSLTTTRI